MDAENIAQLIFKHLKGVQTPAEDAAVNVWRKAHPAHEKLFQRLSDPEYIRQTLGTLDYYKNSDWAIPAEWLPETTVSASGQINWLFPALVAAVIFLMVSTGMVTFFTPFASGKISHQVLQPHRYPAESNRNIRPARLHG